MNTKELIIYETILDSYKRTGRIGKSKPFTLSAARCQAMAVACNIARREEIEKNKPTTKFNWSKVEHTQLKLQLT